MRVGRRLSADVVEICRVRQSGDTCKLASEVK